MNTLLHDSPADVMNNSRIKIYVSSSYEPMVSEYYKKFDDVKPIEGISGAEEECISAVSITELVYMLAEGVEFRLINAADVLLMHQAILNYIQMFKGVSSEPEQQIFLENCNTSIKMLHPFCNNILKQRKDYMRRDPNYEVTLIDIVNDEITRRGLR